MGLEKNACLFAQDYKEGMNPKNICKKYGVSLASVNHGAIVLKKLSVRIKFFNYIYNNANIYLERKFIAGGGLSVLE